MPRRLGHQESTFRLMRLGNATGDPVGFADARPSRRRGGGVLLMGDEYGVARRGAVPVA